MASSSLFISSCSRRQLARRRFMRRALRPEFLFTLLVVAAAFGALFAGRAGV